MPEQQIANPKAVLYTKIAKVTAAMTRVPKRGTQPKYKFATDTDIVESVRAAMTKVNLAVITSMVNYRQIECKTNNDSRQWRTICDFEITLACGDTGEALVARWSNESLDQSDKGFNKAATAALKYFFMKTFLITTGESEEGRRNNQQASAAPPPPPEKADPETGELKPATSKGTPRYGVPSTEQQSAELNWNAVIARANNFYKSESKDRFDAVAELKVKGAFANCKTVDEAAQITAAYVKSQHDEAVPT